MLTARLPGVCAPGAEAVVAHPALDRVVVTDSVPLRGLDPELAQAKVKVLGAAPLVACAIRAMHGSLAAVMEAHR